MHLGSKIPKHLKLNLERTILLFPEHSVVLISESGIHTRNIKNLIHINYFPSESFKKIDLELRHPKDFRNNFWFNTLARFLALEYYMQLTKKECLHVESDVILASDFPFDVFTKLNKKMAFPIVSKNQGIASILYLQNLEATSLLIKVLRNEILVNKQTTDMLILGSLFKMHKEEIQVLPIGPGNSFYYRNSLSPSLLDEMSLAISKFGGVIDGLDVGFYLFGEDPRNHRGVRRLGTSLKNYYLDPKKLKFIFSVDRQFLNIHDGEVNYPIFSIHVHSKNLKLFRFNTSVKLMKKNVERITTNVIREYIFTIFFKSCWLSIKRKLFKLLGIF